MAAQVVEFIDSCPMCQLVKAEHRLPAGLLYPLAVPVRRGWMILLDFLELPPAKSGHDFMQVHIDLHTGQVVNYWQDDWQLLMQLVEFAINNAALPLSTGFTPFYADCCQPTYTAVAGQSSGSQGRGGSGSVDGADDHRGKGPVAGAAGRQQGTPGSRLAGCAIRARQPGAAERQPHPVPITGLALHLAGTLFNSGSDCSEHIKAYLVSSVEGGERVQRVTVALIQQTL